MAVTENATIAQIYDAKLRTYANELSKFRQKENDIIKLLSDENQRIKREVLRDCNATIPFVKKKQFHPNKNGKCGKTNSDKTNRGPKGNRKGQKQGSKGDRRKKPWKGGWDDWNRNDWGKNNDWSEGPSNIQDTTKPAEQQDENKTVEGGKRKRRQDDLRSPVIETRTNSG